MTSSLAAQQNLDLPSFECWDHSHKYKVMWQTQLKKMTLQFDVPPVIRHGLLENGPFIGDVPTKAFIAIFQQAMFDSQGVTMEDHHFSIWDCHSAASSNPAAHMGSPTEISNLNVATIHWKCLDVDSIQTDFLTNEISPKESYHLNMSTEE